MRLPWQQPHATPPDGENRTIGVIFEPNRTDVLTGMGHHLPILDGIVTAAMARRWRVALLPISHWLDSLFELPHYLNGVVLLGPARDSCIVPMLIQEGMPALAIHREAYYPDITRVDIDDEEAMKGIVSYLITCGHQRITFLHWSFHSDIVQARWRGYQAALSEAGLTADEPIVLSESIQAASDTLRLLMRRPNELRPTAIACANDEIAFKVLTAAQEMGVAVPGDISVTGFDDLPDAAHSQPPLTTVCQPLREMGALAARRLIAEILREEAPGERIILPTQCVRRDSVALLSAPVRHPLTLLGL